MNHASIYCKNLDRLDRAAAINAIHQALMQLKAQVTGRHDNLDHKPAIAALRAQLVEAGHLGFTNAADRPDFTVTNHGAIILVQPLSEGATTWLRGIGNGESQWYGNALCVEPRYLDNLIAGLNESGFVGP